MSKTRDRYMFFASYASAADKAEAAGMITREEKLQWYEGITRYALAGIVPAFGGVLACLWEVVRPTMERGRAASARRDKDDDGEPVNMVANTVSNHVHDIPTNTVSNHVHDNMNMNMNMNRTVNKTVNEKKDNDDISREIPLSSSADANDGREQRPDYSPIISAWNAHRGCMKELKSLGRERCAHLAARIKEWGGTTAAAAEKLTALLHAINASDFLSGRSGRWSASFDWLIANDGNWRKVDEGNYDNRESTGMDVGRVHVDESRDKDYTKGMMTIDDLRARQAAEREAAAEGRKLTAMDYVAIYNRSHNGGKEAGNG